MTGSRAAITATIVVCAAAVLAACNVGPDYKTPDIALPASFAEPHGSLSAPSGTDVSKWWTVFGDAELDSLISRALAANLDLQTAASRVRQAREQEIVAGAPEWPSLDVSGLGANFHSNSNPLAQQLSSGSSSGAAAAASSPTNIKLYSAVLDASWQVDLFGGTRRAMEAAHANAEASLWDMHDGEVTLTAEISDDYVNLRAAQARIAMLQSELRDETQLFGIVRDRARAGFVTQLDVNQQKALVENARSQIPQLESQASAMVHAIAVLLAEPPESLQRELETPRPIPVPPPGLPAALPADLLRRRPDIREAERKLAAATADEGVAIAELYPKLNLIGGALLTSNAFSSLFTSQSFGTVGVGYISWPIFEGGRIRANIRSSKEAELQSYFAWRKAVLGALQDVEDALVRYANEKTRETSLAASEQAAASSQTIARQQYVAGLVNFVNVLSAETTLLSARDQLIQSRAALAENIGTIYKALGGGWREDAVDWKTRPAEPENR